ncbi:hypothetical protein AGLY_007174 [Aphis glycines]|uniref:Uncharacterized protein n=1 Tax=Aphis glycines TaxID=307491 RepID=A0A6G0TPA1_APHGL|nr:hypothetical protein AGLY_007174 [Aphis glycines]
MIISCNCWNVYGLNTNRSLRSYKSHVKFKITLKLCFINKSAFNLYSNSRHGKCLGAACKCKFALAFSKGLHGTLAPLSNLLLTDAVKQIAKLYSAHIENIRAKKPNLFSNTKLSTIESDHKLSMRENLKHIYIANVSINSSMEFFLVFLVSKSQFLYFLVYLVKYFGALLNQNEFIKHLLQK